MQNEIPAELWGIGAGFLILMIVIVVVTFLIIIASFYFVFRLLRSMNQNTALLASGEPAQAKILKVWDTGVTLNDNPQVGLLLEIQAENRAAYQAEIKTVVSRLKIPQVQTGATIPVKLNPANPTQIALDLP